MGPQTKVRLITVANLVRPSHQAEAERLLLCPRCVGNVGEVYANPTTGMLWAKVYWRIRGQNWAVNLPLTDFEKA